MIQIVADKPSIMKGISSPTIQNFTKLVSSERYEVPRFQRDYSWKEANWFELWQDVKSILQAENSERFMGYLVLMQKGKSNEIIDGQQRLITISLLMLAFIHNIQKNEKSDTDASRLVQLLKTKFVAELGVSKDTYTNRLVLNENNNDLYKSFISGSPMSRQKLNGSEKSMKSCLKWFTDKIPDLKLGKSEDLANAAINIADSLFFTTLNVSDDLNAYVVFETLNARG
jgi:uncharacterized protein with ParB-like and HNH nuclease domain